MRKRNRIIKGVALTSRMSYYELLATGQDVHENDYVYSLLKETARPMTSREISTLSKIERSSITRILYDLTETQLIRVDKLDKCRVTHKTVNYYVCND